MTIRKVLKKIASYSPVALTTNERYDRLTDRVIRRLCHFDSVCIDVGANEGKILQMFTRHCPGAVHLAFEPIPFLYQKLKRRYTSAARIYNYALSDKAGISDFNFVVTNPAYSGLIRRPYDRPEYDETIQVEVTTLDQIIPAETVVHLIKLDIEGGEYNALQGATTILRKFRPYLLFEFGKGGSEAYGVTPRMMYNFLADHNYHINTLPGFLKNAPPLSYEQFERCFCTGSAFFFLGFTSDNGNR